MFFINHLVIFKSNISVFKTFNFTFITELSKSKNENGTFVLLTFYINFKNTTPVKSPNNNLAIKEPYN